MSVSYCCITKDPKSCCLKNSICSLTVSVGQECKCDLAGPSGSGSLPCCTEGTTGVALTSKSAGGWIWFQTHVSDWWQDSVPLRVLDCGPPFLTGCCLETFSWSLPHGIGKQSEQPEGQRESELTIGKSWLLWSNHRGGTPSPLQCCLLDQVTAQHEMPLHTDQNVQTPEHWQHEVLVRLEQQECPLAAGENTKRYSHFGRQL